MSMATTEKAVFKVHIRGTIDAVWRELTKTDEVQVAMFNTRLETTDLAPGAPIRMRSGRDGKYTGVVGEVLEFEPPHRYAHTFRFTNLDDPPCTMTYVLKEVDDGVEFTLTADGIPSGTKTAKHVKQGGTMIVNTMKSIIETGRAPFGTRMLYAMFRLMEPLTPKRCLSSEWAIDETVNSEQ